MWSLEKLKSSAHSAQGAHYTMPVGQRVVGKVQKNASCQGDNVLILMKILRMVIFVGDDD